jgi:GTP-binding protein Era
MKYMSSMYALEEKYKEILLLKEIFENNIPKISCIGMQNAGKSTLLDALIGDYDKKIFPVSDIRETSTVKEFEYNGILYVDTPGLGYDEKDDKVVYDFIINSDINLFVHNTEGELIKTEVDFLKKIQENWENVEDFINKTIFVISRKDYVEVSDLKRLEERISKQIEDIFNIGAKIVSVSSKDYIEGKQEDEEELIESSNIYLLEKEIKKIDLDLDARKYKLKFEMDKLIKEIDFVVENNNKKISELDYKISNKKSSMDKDKEIAEDTIKNILNRLEEK